MNVADGGSSIAIAIALDIDPAMLPAPTPASPPPRADRVASHPSGCSLAMALSALMLSATASRAELPPWAYGEQQRQAPVVVRLLVREAERVGDEARVSGEVLRVWRQPRELALQRGQTLKVRYTLPRRRGPGVVGPSALPLPQVGETVTAWLQPRLGPEPTFAPAAGGRSFGPSLESFRTP